MNLFSYIKRAIPSLLIALFLLLSAIPCYPNENNIVIHQTISRILTIRTIKKFQIEELFSKWQRDVSSLAELISILPGIKEKNISKKQINFLTKYLKIYEYDDLLLIDNKGYCFFTVKEKGENQTNVIKGDLSNSGLATLINTVIKTKQPSFVDFSEYSLNNNAPSAFIAHPIILEGNMELIVALQVPLKEINKIMQLREGLGQTGESYLIGEDKLMRSDSLLYQTVKSSFANKSKGGINTESANSVISGLTYSKSTIDYYGNEVLSSFSPIKIGNITWGIIVEINKAEVLEDPFSKH